MKLEISNKLLILLFGTVLILLLIALLFIQFLKPKKFHETSLSMKSTFEKGVFCEQKVYFFTNLKRGDIVLYRVKDDEIKGQRFLSRVIGLPGETVTIIDNEVMVDGMVLDEDYLPGNTVTFVRDKNEWKVNREEYFLMGDNRSFSSDSRFSGPINREYIVSKIFEC